jgi:hypothetical protein
MQSTHELEVTEMPRPEETGPQAGYILEIHGHRLKEPVRKAEILEVLGEPGHQHFRVRWDDGRESIFYPPSDAIIRPGRRGKATTA